MKLLAFLLPLQTKLLKYGESPRESHGSGQTNWNESLTFACSEYADGRVVWSMVDGLRDGYEDDPASNPDDSFYGHSRQDSFASTGSSQNGGNAPSWPANYNTPALNLRHRDRGAGAIPSGSSVAAADGQPRPVTVVFHTDTRDAADLIDQLSRNTGASNDVSRGRIDFSHLYPGSNAAGGGVGGGAFEENETAHSSPFPYSATQSRAGDAQSSSPDPRFADPPSPEPTSRQMHHHQNANGRSVPPPIHPPPASAHVPAGGFSPKRQMMLRQGFGAHRANVHLGSAHQVNQNMAQANSPSGISFASSTSSGGAQRSVEERLQNLLDRLRTQNDRDEAQARARAPQPPAESRTQSRQR